MAATFLSSPGVRQFFMHGKSLILEKDQETLPPLSGMTVTSNTLWSLFIFNGSGIRHV
ncbi:MAG: hypothetical protein GX776_01310 [Oxalobacter sp.]|nr:hypothetical protein [Oxalobacter sp.]